MTLDSKQQEVLNNLLLEAVKNNDATHVRLYADKGADVTAAFNQYDSYTGRWRSNPLYHFMPTSGFSTEISDFLISRGVDVDVKDYSGNTRLMLAVQSHDLSLVKYFLSKGADPFAKNDREDIVLDQARQIPSDYTVRQKIIDALVEAIDAPVHKAEPAAPEAGNDSAANPVETTHEVRTLKPLELVPRKKNGGGLNL